MIDALDKDSYHVSVVIQGYVVALSQEQVDE